MTRAMRTILLSLSVLLLCSGCGASAPPSPAAEAVEERSVELFAMDTYMNIRAWGTDDALLAQAKALVTELESELSVTDERSAIYTLNHSGAAKLPANAAELLDRALALCDETGGALDISIYPVVRAWGFTLGEDAYRVPTPETLESLLESVDYTRVSFDGVSAALPAGMEIDLGSVAKGYTGDRLAGLLRDGGVHSALLDLGGNIQTVGTKPDGSDWRVGIRMPEGDGLLGAVSVSDKAVVTSGGYERYFIDDAGNLWWHIMDPDTGYPAKNGLISVTVIGDEGLYCDALSTSLFIMGPEGAAAFWRAHRDFEMVLVTDSGELRLTPGLTERFAPSASLPYTISYIADA